MSNSVVPSNADLGDPALQEAKEAVADALVNLVADRVSGAGDDGQFVFDAIPHRAFVSGHLLPRYDSAGDDDTSDIHLSAVGLDVQVKSDATGIVTVRPSFSLYVRVLPSWSDVAPQVGTLATRFSFTPEVKAELFRKTTELRARKRAEAGVPERIEEDDTAKRRAAFEKLKQIRREAYSEAREHLGLPAIISEAVLRSAPLLEAPRGDSQDSTSGAAHTGDEPDDGAGVERDDVVAADSLASLLLVPPQFLTEIEAPMKWTRLVPDLPTFHFDLAWGEEALEKELRAFQVALADAMGKCFRDWVSSESGALWAWRDRRLRPGDLRGLDAWESFLASARTAPVIADDIRPCLGEIVLRVERKRDFADPGRSAIRVLLENNNQAPRRAEARHRELAVFQVGLDTVLPSPPVTG
jgi:hypothetical protein